MNFSAVNWRSSRMPSESCSVPRLDAPTASTRPAVRALFRVLATVLALAGMREVSDRITVNVDQCGGRPCIRGMRIRVSDVLDLLASGLSHQQVLEELPDLEADDIAACLRFASRRVDHPIVAA
jgi:uncharacterized protein (DUF433 family)